MTVGERIKEIRLKTGMSQVEFADKINVSKQTLYKYENNIITNIPSDKIESAAKIGNVSPAYLMGWEGHTKAAASITLYNMQCKTKDEAELLLSYREISDVSKKRVSSYICNIRDIERADLEVNAAAHERTDIDVTDEMRKYDDSIMDDEDEWE